MKQTMCETIGFHFIRLQLLMIKKKYDSEKNQELHLHSGDAIHFPGF